MIGPDHEHEENVRKMRNVTSRAALLCATYLIGQPIIQQCIELDQRISTNDEVGLVDETLIQHRQRYLGKL